jgi:glycosyltransferase involved in cell wall biosynthesis
VTSGQPRVTVIMPTFDQAPFLPRALSGLLAQSMTAWELIVVDDASTDETPSVVAPYRSDPRVRYTRLPRNVDVGGAINHGLALAAAKLIAYLPSDDHFFPEHLESLVDMLDRWPEATLAFSGMRYWQNHSVPGQREGEPLQLVQVMHRTTPERWIERSELVTDDLERMFWSRLRARGEFVGTGRVTCEWVDHRAMRHKRIRETLGGGLNVYRSHYQPAHPLRFESSVGNRIDEAALYEDLRRSRARARAQDGLKILLVGELAYNPERVLALEERGHTLYGLWTDQPYWFSTVGPLPFGHVKDLDRRHWLNEIRTVRPDVIYGLLNWQAVPFVHRILMEDPGIPFVWHLKESPQHCIAEGTWPKLVDLHLRSDGQIYSSPELRDWFATVLPATRSTPSLVLDGDLPKRDWFREDPPVRHSSGDGEIHTVVPGRLIGLDPPMVGQLARRDIHLHFYGNIFHAGSRGWIDEVLRIAPDHLHLHDAVDQRRWRSEFGRYDAGWLHVFESDNQGDLRRARWDDLNYPARLATLMAAGVPVIQRDNSGSVVATQSIARRHGTGLFFREIDQLADQLHDSRRMVAARAAVEDVRDRFAFDAHADDLISFFQQVIGRPTALPRTASVDRATELVVR